MGLVFPLVTRGNAKGHLLFGASWRGAAPASTRGHRDASKLSARGHAQVGTSPAALPSFLINVRKKKKRTPDITKTKSTNNPARYRELACNASHDDIFRTIQRLEKEKKNGTKQGSVAETTLVADDAETELELGRF